MRRPAPWIPLLALALPLACASSQAPPLPPSRLSSLEPTPSRERPTVEEYLAQADQMRDTGDHSQAVLQYFRAMQTAPDDPEPRERVGYLQITRDPERAAGIFEGLLGSDPERTSALTGRGLASLQSGDLEGARRALERAVELNPDGLEAIVALAVTCDWAGDRPCADRYYERALEIDPQHPDVHANRGVSQLLEGRYGEAAESFRVALRTRPDDAGLHNNLGLALGRIGQFDAALAAFEQGGTAAEALNNLGYTYYLAGQPDRALEQYERALRLQPANPLPILRNIRDAEQRVAERRLRRAVGPPPSAPDDPRD